MEDVERFKKLIKGGDSCISIVTYEERYTLDIIIRNLRGLMRRQVQNIIIDTVAEDRRFDDDDIIFVLFRL